MVVGGSGCWLVDATLHASLSLWPNQDLMGLSQPHLPIGQHH